MVASTSGTVMSGQSYGERIAFHDALEVLEVDFSRYTFAAAPQVDDFYNEIDRQLEASGRSWYFLVNYVDCVIQPEVWDRFAERGRHTNTTYGLGTVRVGASEEIRETIRKRSETEDFRSSLFATREEALEALADMRRRHRRLAAAGAEPTAPPLLKADDIHLSFGGVLAIQGVSFDVQRGEILAIIGPNGAGKTSMLNVINGFYHPQQGTITYKGKTRQQMRPHEAAKQGIARTFQNVALFKGMSVLDNIMSGRLLKMKGSFLLEAIYLGPARKQEMRHREYVEHVIDFLEIQDIRRTPAGRLPYGLQKRVEFARALAAEPDLLLLDEPMAGMNVEEKEDMCRFILDTNEEFGTTIALIEHDMSVVMDISNYVVVLDHGEKISEGVPSEVQSDPVVIRAYLGEG